MAHRTPILMDILLSICRPDSCASHSPIAYGFLGLPVAPLRDPIATSYARRLRTRPRGRERRGFRGDIMTASRVTPSVEPEAILGLLPGRCRMRPSPTPPWPTHVLAPGRAREWKRALEPAWAARSQTSRCGLQGTPTFQFQTRSTFRLRVAPEWDCHGALGRVKVALADARRSATLTRPARSARGRLPERPGVGSWLASRSHVTWPDITESEAQ